MSEIKGVRFGSSQSEQTAGKKICLLKQNEHVVRMVSCRKNERRREREKEREKKRDKSLDQKKGFCYNLINDSIAFFMLSKLLSFNIFACLTFLFRVFFSLTFFKCNIQSERGDKSKHSSNMNRPLNKYALCGGCVEMIGMQT